MSYPVSVVMCSAGDRHSIGEDGILSTCLLGPWSGRQRVWTQGRKGFHDGLFRFASTQARARRGLRRRVPQRHGQDVRWSFRVRQRGCFAVCTFTVCSSVARGRGLIARRWGSLYLPGRGSGRARALGAPGRRARAGRGHAACPGRCFQSFASGHRRAFPPCGRAAGGVFVFPVWCLCCEHPLRGRFSGVSR